MCADLTELRALKKPLNKFFCLTIQIWLIFMNKNVNIKNIIIDKPLHLDCGKTINNYSLA